MDTLEKKIDSIFQTWIDNPGPGGQLLVTRGGKTVFEKCYGYANLETQTPMTPDSVFHVASVSKQFTAMAIAMLHEQGKLNVEDDVRKYVPDLIGFSEPLTIRQMMNHVSGMRCHYALMYLQGRSSEDCVTHGEMLRIIRRQKNLNFQPGEEFMYSNPNYVLMATIVERLSGMSFPTWVKKNIFEPLGMESSFIREDPRMPVPGKVSSYNDNGYTFKNAIVHLTMYGSTGVNMTCRDLNKYIQQYQNPTLISRKTMEEVLFRVPEVKKGTTIYGGGLRFQELLGHRIIHHGGVNGGFRTFGMLMPDDDLIVTVFTNVPTIPIETAGRDVARVILDLPPRKIPTMDEFYQETADLTNVPGFYYCDKNGDNFNLDVRDGTVYCDNVPLEHKGGNLYKKGRLNFWLAVGEDMVIRDNGNTMHIHKQETPAPEELAKACVGTYYNDECQAIWSVNYENGKLWLDHLRHGRSELHWLEGERFFAGMRKIQFTRNAEGKVDGYLYTVSQIRNMRFEKVK